MFTQILTLNNCNNNIFYTYISEIRKLWNFTMKIYQRKLPKKVENN